MVLFGFGDYDYVSSPEGQCRALDFGIDRAGSFLTGLSLVLQACRNIPSLPICNLFFRQLLTSQSCSKSSLA